MAQKWKDGRQVKPKSKKKTTKKKTEPNLTCEGPVKAPDRKKEKDAPATLRISQSQSSLHVGCIKSRCVCVRVCASHLQTLFLQAVVKTSR